MSRYARFYDAACRGPDDSPTTVRPQYVGVEPQHGGRVWLFVNSEEHGESQHVLLDPPALRSLAALLSALADEGEGDDDGEG
jgi:hypothetical protein